MADGKGDGIRRLNETNLIGCRYLHQLGIRQCHAHLHPQIGRDLLRYQFSYLLTTIHVAVMNSAKVKDFENNMDQSKMGHLQISWKHLWANFFLAYHNEKLLDDDSELQDYGLRNNSQHCSKDFRKVGVCWRQQIALSWGVKSELKKLEETLSTIKAVLLDAEDQQAKNRQLSLWLERLKDACYDVDDVLDEFSYEALQQQMVTRGSLKTKVHNLFSHSNINFRFVMGHKIKEIRERLDEIAASKGQFHLMERDVDLYVETRESREREMTHSFVRPSDVIGRVNEREKIVELLTCRGIDQNFFVVSIVGIAGLGKTTIAKLVYNDERVNVCFQLRIWVCVSDDFNLIRLAKDIIKSATCENCSDLSIDQLQTRLRNTLQGKKFLLVLDDVWNEDLEKWNKLRELLLDGSNGSKIVVTTRSHVVASIMGTVPSYNLEGLPDEDCWSLFMKCAFKEVQEVKQHPNLEEIGKEIVKKCQGVPLAVRTLGSLVFMKTDERDWMSIRDNEIWKLEQGEDYILPALKLSYKQLPSYLKQCFAFCSIFPKDYMFSGSKLVQMWIAQSFIQSSNEKEELEDIGNRYIKELWSRSFFEDIQEHGTFISFKMHDLVHDLAIFVAQTDCYAINFHSNNNISNRVRHVSFCDWSLSTEEAPRFLLNQQNLRTILFPVNGLGPTSKSFVESCIRRFKFIRLLDLSGSSFEVLPSFVGKLKHLRYLDITGNHAIKILPNSICKLKNLQTLRLDGCKKLEKFPRDIGNLISLRSLSVATKQMFLELEKGIGYLTSLGYIWVGECPNLRSLGEGMERLTALRTLAFRSCRNLESFPRSMKYLPALETLIIWDCEKLNLTEWEDDFHDLKLMSLRSLFLYGLPQLETLPLWLQGVANTLQDIHIAGCYNLMELPEWLQKLGSLQKLEIWNSPLLSSLPDGMHRLTSLRELLIYFCPELSRRCKQETGDDWHKIAHIPEITLEGRKIKSTDYYL